MTRDEAIQVLRDWDGCFIGHRSDDVNEALNMAIKALEQEPTTKNDLGVDCISRADAIRVASGYCHPSNVANELAKLPSVTPQEPRWISVSEGLPEEGQWVMVTFDGKIAVCIAHDNDGTLREATSLVLKNATEIWLYPESEWGDGYAAWMPLPAPYEPQESEDKE